MTVLTTERLILRRMTADDAPFVLELLNDPEFIRYIGDRGVRTLDDAKAYIANGPVAMYERHGFGLYTVELKDRRTAIGMCGLIKRDALEDVDIGFAFLPKYRSQGYALEAASATMDYARDVLGIPRIVAITTPDNESSIRLLEKIGLTFDRMIRMPGETADSALFRPLDLDSDAFRADDGERAWERRQVPAVVAMLVRAGLGLLGGELWWVPGASRAKQAFIPQRHGPEATYSWDLEPERGESWPAFVRRAATATLEAVERWPEPGDLPDDLPGRIVYNLTWVTREEFDELDNVGKPV